MLIFCLLGIKWINDRKRIISNQFLGASHPLVFASFTIKSSPKNDQNPKLGYKLKNSWLNGHKIDSFGAWMCPHLPNQSPKKFLHISTTILSWPIGLLNQEYIFYARDCANLGILTFLGHLYVKWVIRHDEVALKYSMWPKNVEGSVTYDCSSAQWWCKIVHGLYRPLRQIYFFSCTRATNVSSIIIIVVISNFTASSILIHKKVRRVSFGKYLGFYRCKIHKRWCNECTGQ